MRRYAVSILHKLPINLYLEIYGKTFEIYGKTFIFTKPSLFKILNMRVAHPAWNLEDWDYLYEF